MFGFNFMKNNKDGTYTDILIEYMTQRVGITNLAIEIAANKIADVVSKLGFMVLTRNQKDNLEGDYTFNVKPNANQSATDFWKQVVYKMITNRDGCVVVNLQERGLFIVENYSVTDTVIKEKTYYDVTVKVDDDTLRLNRTFKSSDVMHFRYTNTKLIKLLEKNNELVEEVWNVVINGMKLKVPKIVLRLPGGAKMQTADGRIVASNEYAETLARRITSKDLKAIVASNQTGIEVLDTKSSVTKDDLRAMKEEIFDNVAIAMGIPKNVFYGEVTSNADANDAFITYACAPVIRVLDNVIQGAYLTKEEYMAGDRIVVKTFKVKHVDVIGNANNLDKLYQNGWSHNDILTLLFGMPPINEPWANERRFTKNYASTLEGGEQK